MYNSRYAPILIQGKNTDDGFFTLSLGFLAMYNPQVILSKFFQYGHRAALIYI